jgi:hypothetical protein
MLFFKKRTSLKVRVNDKWVETSDDFKKMHEETMKRLGRDK